MTTSSQKQTKSKPASNVPFEHMSVHGVECPLWQTQAVRAGPFIFTSAVLATDWIQEIAPEASVNPNFPYFFNPSELQTEYILGTLAKILAQSGSSLERIVKANVFLADSKEFPGFDRVWKRFFPNPPTRTTVGAGGLILPNASLEISLTVLASDCNYSVEPASSDAPRPLTKKVEAVRAGDFVFTSGQLAHDAENGVPAEAAGPNGEIDMAKQTTYTIGNMARSIEAAGASKDKVVKGQGLLVGDGGFDDFLSAWKREFKQGPAIGITQIGSLLVTDTIVEIDLTAYTGDDLRYPRSLGRRGADAVGCGEIVFSSGICPGYDTGRLPEDCIVHPAYPQYASSIKLQTKWVLDRLDKALRSVGSNSERIAKAQVFLTDLNDFSDFEEIWREHFPKPPARSVIKVEGLPVEGAKIAVEVVAATE